ncbi:hypothetical protein PCANC_23072 [Puccinia coronata f. sp. avenae]|uniref:Uncharacterized protein n=1 Tax=Puccinia coronata f. sp. avenae TaxID=200324 RepID=A0A2N5SDE4_9BASI|nr:hypothetical protein PCANC_23072 [Puccinia coronata f. sp. avenae]
MHISHHFDYDSTGYPTFMTLSLFVLSTTSPPNIILTMNDLTNVRIHDRFTDPHLCLAMKLIILIIIVTILYEWSKNLKSLYNNSKLTGAKYTDFLLVGNSRRCRAILRLDPGTFELLAQKLLLLDTNPVSKRLGIEEQLAIFMYIVGQGATNRQAQDQFQHSGKTISKVFHHIIALLIGLSSAYIQLPNPRVTHRTILDNPKYSPFFDDCLGALDGVHVPAKVPEAQAAPFCNWKGQLSQNVLAVVDFDMRFTYICAGWEGSAHNSRVLTHARGLDFSIPTGSFYLADAGYSLNHGILVPYRGVRYHLREQAAANQRPSNKEELFNLRHSSMRNVVERTFGVWKKQFPILSHALDYNLDTQRNLVFALAVVHNFAIDHGHVDSDDFFNLTVDDISFANEQFSNPGNPGEEQVPLSNREKTMLQEWRDGTAERMWSQYQDVLSQQHGNQTMPCRRSWVRSSTSTTRRPRH